MSYGHGANGPLRDVVDVFGKWSCNGGGNYYRKVKLSCGHIVAQIGSRHKHTHGDYKPDDIRNLKTHKTAYCHICKLEEENE
jgi:hypothetical protein